MKNIHYIGEIPYSNLSQKNALAPVNLLLHPAVMKVIGDYVGQFPRAISNDKYNDYIKKVCKLAGIHERIQGTKAEVIKMMCGGCFVKVTRKKQGLYDKWELVSSHISRRSFASNHFRKIATPIIMAATGHKSESSFLKYIGKSRAEMASMLADYWYKNE